MRQSVLLALLAITLAVNVILGAEMYVLTHPHVSGASPVYVNYSAVNETKAVTVSNGTSFSYEYGLTLSFPNKGVYTLSISPVGFKSLYVVVYLDDGRTLTLSLNKTGAHIIVDEKEIHMTVYVTGVYEGVPTPQVVFKSLNLSYQYLGPLQSVSEGEPTSEGDH